jgi:hypothetical protein
VTHPSDTPSFAVALDVCAAELTSRGVKFHHADKHSSFGIDKALRAVHLRPESGAGRLARKVKTQRRYCRGREDAEDSLSSQRSGGVARFGEADPYIVVVIHPSLVVS